MGGFMNLEIKSVHYELEDELKEYIEKKIHRIDYALDLLVDLQIIISKEKRRFKIECNINFRWNYATHMKVVSYDLKPGIDKLLDKLDNKILKEKEKIQKHQ